MIYLPLSVFFFFLFSNFEQYALRMLTYYYRISETNAKRLVLVPNVQWEDRSILQIARRFKFRQVISHDVCQDIFNQFWKGKVRSVGRYPY